MNALFRQDQFSNESYMRRAYPALFARYPHPKMSPKYGFTDTYHLLKHLSNRGYTMRTVQQTGRGEYGKTLTRMQHPTLHRTADGCAEIVVIDSHDGTSSLMVALGYLRFVCANGLVLGDSVFVRKYKHTQPDLVESIILDLEEADGAAIRNAQTIERMKQRILCEVDAMQLATSVAEARFGSSIDIEAPSGVSRMRRAANALLSSRRRESDMRHDLFTTLNVLQENAMRGGLWYTHAGARHNVQPIKSIQKEVDINRAAWSGAMKLLEGV